MARIKGSGKYDTTFKIRLSKDEALQLATMAVRLKKNMSQTLREAIARMAAKQPAQR
jgi:predicted transcriptional regulator